MLVVVRRAVTLPRRLFRPAPTGGADAGFTLLEMMIAVVIIGIVMSAVTTLFVSAMQAAHQQSGRQSATQLAGDAIEKIRALKGSSLSTGRDRTSTDNQWSAPAPGVGPYLADMQRTWDSTAVYPAGGTALVPTSPTKMMVSGVDYWQNWYLGKCWQPLGGGDCLSSKANATDIEFFRVVVAVTWQERQCTAPACSYVTSTLVNDASSEPVFNANDSARAPAVINPGNQVGDVTVAVSLLVEASGGADPLTWSASGLPTGLSMASNGLISGTPDKAGLYSVTVSVTDAFNLVGTAAFNWSVNRLPMITDPATQTTPGGIATSLSMSFVGGTLPVTWTAANLPTGLTINAATGTISGTPTATGTKSVTVTVTDTFKKADASTFTWTVPALAIQTPAAQSGEATAPDSLQVVASGGVVPYTWSTTGLPPGLSIDATGYISGTPTTAGTYNTVVSVTDAAKTKVSTASFNWTIIAGPSIDWTTTVRNDNVTDAVNLAIPISGGTTPYTWTATNLPPGISITSAGRLVGTLTRGTRYVVTLYVTDAAGGNDSYRFVWEVDPTGNSLRITSPLTDRSNVVGASPSFTAAATKGAGFGYTWSATGLPPGLSITTGGAVFGRLTTAGSYLVRLTVKDGAGNTAVTMFTWTVS